MSEFVYILTNDWMDGLSKIGFSKDPPRKRIAELSGNTGVPVPFTFVAAIRVDDARDVEKLLHELFSDRRVNPKREFFEISPERILTAFKLTKCHHADIDGNIVGNETFEQTAIDETGFAVVNKRRIRPPFSFFANGIPVGSILEFVRNPEKKCEVVDDRRVKYNGEICYLSYLANKLLNESGTPIVGVQGTLYFTFEGQILTEIRNQNEKDME
jgi:hypothetical protein